jgi:ribosome maturation factor RimP
MSTGPEKINEIAERVAASYGIEVVEVELKGSGKGRFLRVFIDRPEGVSHEDCANVSRELSTILDVEDAVPGAAYTLEVSSPGLDRKLLKPADWTRFQGSLVKVSTFDAINNNRHFEGRLTKFEDGKVTLDLTETHSKKKQKQQGTGEIVIELRNVEKANLVPEI